MERAEGTGGYSTVWAVLFQVSAWQGVGGHLTRGHMRLPGRQPFKLMLKDAWGLFRQRWWTERKDFPDKGNRSDKALQARRQCDRYTEKSAPSVSVAEAWNPSGEG